MPASHAVCEKRFLIGKICKNNHEEDRKLVKCSLPVCLHSLSNRVELNLVPRPDQGSPFRGTRFWIPILEYPDEGLEMFRPNQLHFRDKEAC
ncbi:hypothetical protein BH11VER1_BH11VER1_25990 [soil metagenome]